ncbi:MAG: SDR family oxidoreductase [Candidatus Hodarchaeales archaeon]|jgi:3-oxoacyl-[acyl-carrier protein] reductase
MDLELNQKVALVAASSSGLGKAVAIKLAKEGADIIICSRNSDKLKLVTEEIQKMERRCLAIPTDLTQLSQVQNLVTRSIEYFGKIDILITNCGGPPSGGFLDFSIEDWKQAIDLNLMSTIYLCKKVIPYMIKQQAGRIVMITSISVKQPIQGLILSNVARAGVAGLAKSLSNEFGKNNILVNIVCPGYTQTQRVEQLAAVLSAEEGVEPNKMIERWANQNALKRIATPEEFANVVVFLASEKASHLTGTAIQIDGGYVKALL